jgi:hypothetical protein
MDFDGMGRRGPFRVKLLIPEGHMGGFYGASERDRTSDLLITNELL